MFGLIGAGIYFLPTLVAAARHTHNAAGIFLFNFFSGWTGIGWIIALIMAACSAPWPTGWYPYHGYPATCAPPPPRP